MSNSDCIFCKIVSGEIPSLKLSEGRYTIAILDANPVSLGHTLIITKEHHEDITNMSREELAEIAEQQQLLAPAISAVTGCAAYNLLNNTGELAGQVIKHCHFHIIPRYEDDGIVMAFGKVELDEDTKLELADQIRENI